MGHSMIVFEVLEALMDIATCGKHGWKIALLLLIFILVVLAGVKFTGG